MSFTEHYELLVGVSGTVLPMELLAYLEPARLRLRLFSGSLGS